MGFADKGYPCNSMGVAVCIQLQACCRWSTTWGAVLWWHGESPFGAVTTSSENTFFWITEGIETGSYNFQVVAVGEVDTVYSWRWFAKSTGQIAVLISVVWREASCAYPKVSSGCVACEVSAPLDETCWRWHHDLCSQEQLLGVWSASDGQACEEDVCAMPAPGRRGMYPTHGSITWGSGESSSAFCSDGSWSCRAAVLLWYSSKEILGTSLYMWRGACCAPRVGWWSLNLWHGSCPSALGWPQRSAKEDLLWQCQRVCGGPWEDPPSFWPSYARMGIHCSQVPLVGRVVAKADQIRQSCSKENGGGQLLGAGWIGDNSSWNRSLHQ